MLRGCGIYWDHDVGSSAAGVVSSCGDVGGWVFVLLFLIREAVSGGVRFALEHPEW